MSHLDTEYNEVIELPIREQILLRPQQWVGDFSVRTESEFYFDIENDNSLTYGEITYSAGLAKLFDEAITNATDNYQRYPSLRTKIEVDITPKYFRVKNYGPSLLIKKEIGIDKNEYYSPEITFSHMFSSSNYKDDKDKDRTANGQNGVGIKLANIFATKFKIEIVNNKQKYRQTFKNNMEIIEEPEITKTKDENSVEVICYPDFKKLGIEEIDEGNMAHLLFRAFSCVIFGRSIIINKNEFSGMRFNEYAQELAQAYLSNEYPKFEFENSEASALIYVIPRNANIFSYVNNIYTSDNGTHVNRLIKQINDEINNTNKDKGKGKNIKNVKNVNNFNPKNYLLIFLNQTVKQPKFEGQAKNKLTSRNLTTDFSDLVLDLKQSDDLYSYMLNKKVKTNKNQKLFYKKCDPANKAGTKESMKCTLFITEGDSATGMVRKGFNQLGRDYYGVYTLKGKPINVVKAMPNNLRSLGDPIRKIDNNEIIVNLLKEIGLTRGAKPLRKDLRYGRIVMVKDADVDGDAIMGLLYNVFYTFFKDLLLDKDNPFFYEFTTPAFQIYEDDEKTLLEEYSTLKMLKEAQDRYSSQNHKIKVHYMKGLGAIPDPDVERYFDDIDKHLIPVVINDDTQADAYMTMVYGKGKICADARKKWVMKADPNKVLERADGMEEMDIVDFQRYSCVHYAYDDCDRSMICYVDGLKPSYRKILYTLFRSGNSAYNFQKVTSLSGDVSKYGKYLHGEASLEETIFNLMGYWAGSNNVRLLVNRGHIGCRLDMGKCHAQSRYVETALNKITRLIYPKEDDNILKPVYEEGERAQPEFYVPIIPIALINGSCGIGVGFSNTIPNHNQYDCINYIKSILNKDENLEKLTNFRTDITINPYYPEYNGEIENYDKGYISYGVQEWIMPPENENRKNKNKFWETELIKGKKGNHPLDYNPAFLKVSEIPVGINFHAKIDEIKEYLAEKYGQKKSKKTGTGKNKKDKESESESEDTETENESETENEEGYNVKNIKKNCWPKLIDYMDKSADGTAVIYDKIEIIFKIDNSSRLPDNFQIIPMYNHLYTTNMHTFSETGRIKKFDTIYDLMNKFMKVRFDYYLKRKEYKLNLLKNNIIKASNRARFVKFKVEGLNDNEDKGRDENGKIMKGHLDTRGIKLDTLIKIMENSNFDKRYEYINEYDNLVEKFVKSTSDKGDYDYIIDFVTTRKETIEEYKRLLKEVEKNEEIMEEYSKIHVRDMWLEDLDKLENELHKLDKSIKKIKDENLLKQKRKNKN